MTDINGILFNIAQSLPGFLLAIVAHEAAHAWMANKFGDPTAKNEGRLTLNPGAHYDPIGTIFFPIIAAVTNLPMIGWAKPVPIVTRNFKKIRQGIFWVSFAGILANMVLALVSAIIFALIITKVSSDWGFYSISLQMLRYSITINVLLAFFNLIPIPPLDGSKMVAIFLKGETLRKYESIENYSQMIFIGILLLSFLGIHTIGYILQPAFSLANSIMFGLVGFFGEMG